ncbi:MAG: ComEC/Rec2 family competence protein [Rhodothermales bacterium]|nr:ComEC/Rec2 family competence protein [Rhodothermales bacterium]MBO6778826.1 ComEC/Rec2 family competence protein [Rhodothermales bacterium]
MVDPRALARSRNYHAVVEGTAVIVEPASPPLLLRRHDLLFQGRDPTGVVRAMTTGDRTRMREALPEQFRQAGLAHVLAISGFHVSVVGLAVFGLAAVIFSALQIPTATRLQLRAGVTLGALVAYAAATGGSAATTRAALMGGLVLWQGARGHGSVSGIHTVLLAGLVLGVVLPGLVWTPAYLLSFCAVYGLVRDCGSSRNPVVMSLVAVLFTAPASAAFFQRITPVSVVSNLLGGPLAGLVMVAAVAAHLTGIQWFVVAADAAAQLLVLVAGVFASIPGLPVLSGRALWLVPALVLGSLPGTAAGRRVVTICAMALVLLIPQARGPLEIWFLDVDQGDAALVRTPHGTSLLIDTGPPSARYVVASAIGHLAPGGLDHSFISHPHRDHDGNRQLAESRVRPTSIGTLLKPDPEIRLLPLAPEPGLVGGPNQLSSVLLLAHGRVRFLFTGDAEGASESMMTRRWDSLLAAQVVKVPHHGSTTSSHRFLVSRARVGAPGWAVISVGRSNRYGLPDPRVVDRWMKAGYQVLTTADSGSVYCRSDGEQVRCVPFSPGRD